MICSFASKLAYKLLPRLLNKTLTKPLLYFYHKYHLFTDQIATLQRAYSLNVPNSLSIDEEMGINSLESSEEPEIPSLDRSVHRSGEDSETISVDGSDDDSETGSTDDMPKQHKSEALDDSSDFNFHANSDSETRLSYDSGDLYYALDTDFSDFPVDSPPLSNDMAIQTTTSDASDSISTDSDIV